MPKQRPTAVLVTTFNAESLAVTEHLAEPVQERQHHEERGTLYEIGTFTGRHGAWTVAVAEIGPGNSTAGAEVERAHAAFAPDVVLLVGVAGGVKDLGLGDVVAADAVYDYESGKDTDDGYLPRIKTQSSSHRLLQHARLVARHAQWQQRIRPAGPPTPPPQAVVKPVAAGGMLVAGARSRSADLLRRYCSDAVAVEMEGYGFLRGAYLNHAAEALVVRGVSDLLSGKDQVNDERWQPAAARHAAAFAFALLDSVHRTAADRGDPPPAAVAQSGKYNIGEIHGHVQIGDGNTQWNVRP
jgi:nucleoside phosphorylase